MYKTKNVHDSDSETQNSPCYNIAALTHHNEPLGFQDRCERTGVNMPRLGTLTVRLNSKEQNLELFRSNHSKGYSNHKSRLDCATTRGSLLVTKHWVSANNETRYGCSWQERSPFVQPVPCRCLKHTICFIAPIE